MTKADESVSPAAQFPGPRKIAPGESTPRNPQHKRGRTVLVVLWIAATAGAVAALVLAPGNQAPGLLVCIVFVAGLVWTLVRTGPPAARLPDLNPLVLPGLGFWGMTGAIVASLGMLFVLGIAFHPWLVLVVAFTAIALCTMVAWRRRLSARLVLFGLAAGLVIGLANLPRLIGTDELSGNLFSMAVNTLTVPPLFIAGALLLDRTGLARIRLLDGDYALGLRGFLWSCALALPPALVNVLGGPNSGDAWVDRWWEPLYALQPGIAEETWARLFLTTLCYTLLRPTTNARPRRAVAAAVLIGALTHSLAHVPTPAIPGPAGVAMLFTGLLYGVPMAMLFIKRDFEHAVAYHFFIDFVRFVAALVGSGEQTW